MDLHFDYRLWQINIFILLTLSIQNSCTVSLSDIKEICCIDSGKKAIHSLPTNNNCTGIAWYSNGKTSTKQIDHLKGNLKKVFIYQDVFYYNYGKFMQPSNMNRFLKEIRELIRKKGIDILIFDGMYQDYYNNNLQMDIRRMVLRLKITNPDLLCGIFIGLTPGVNLQYLKKVVPFFVLKSFGNYPCYHNKNQANMSLVDPVDEIENKVKEILTIINSQQLCIGVRIIVKSTKSGIADPSEDESYTDFCHKHADEKRRYCIEKLPNFYKKGRLVSKYNLAGAIIQSLDRDDYGCKCGCGCYPVMTSIDAGIQGLPEPQVTNCSTWTLLKKDRD